MLIKQNFLILILLFSSMNLSSNVSSAGKEQKDEHDEDDEYMTPPEDEEFKEEHYPKEDIEYTKTEYEKYLDKQKHHDDIIEVDNHLFGSMIGIDQFVWIVKISSKKCESCKEFWPVYELMAKNFNHIKYGVIYLENPEAEKLVKKFKGVMDKGLPAVILLKDQDPYKFTQLVAGNSKVTEKELRKMVIPLIKDFKYTTGLYKRKPGEYEQNHDEL